jgi:4-amino-4-deoxy-L-arabinose transferase-like glycosyltransferase
LLLVLLLAAGLRFWQLGEIPPGFYRDEAFNGLDAIDVLTGQRPEKSLIYFEANNGREPVYNYLTTLAVAFLGRTVLAVRVTAAVIGTLTTWLTFLLAKNWFNWHIGLLAAFLWAITVWPIHLSRIGLRPILLPFMLALVFWLGTLAYRQSTSTGLIAGKRGKMLWLLTGLMYGAAFYTYLAVRFTPLLLLLLLLYLAAAGRWQRVKPGIGWFLLGTIAAALPLALLVWQQPDILLGRSSQVSILNPEVSGGATLLSTLWQQSWQALGLFFWKGDMILRHNPPGRPVFDLFMTLPFLMGLIWCLRRWRQPQAGFLLLWSGVMLGPTILAEDTPHFLRAVGLLPAIVIFPAIGLARLWAWPGLSHRVGQVVVPGLLLASLTLTVKDYFLDYGRKPETGYWFEAAARDLADNINNYEVSPARIYVDQRFWDGWPAVRFLLEPEQPVIFYKPETLTVNQFSPGSVVYAWPYEHLDLTLAAMGAGLIRADAGSLAQGDLEPAAYPFYSRYSVESLPSWPVLANFDNSIQLRHANVIESQQQQTLIIDLYWSIESFIDSSLIVFVHLVGPDGLIAQSDNVPAQGMWPSQWWQPGLIIRDQHHIDLEEGFDPAQHQIIVGIYHADTKVRLAAYRADGTPVGDTWLLQP